MNDLRTAAQQALEAAENRLPLIGQAAIIDELNALRAALAQQEQAEPVAWMLALPDGRLDRLSVTAFDDEAEEMLTSSISGCTMAPLYAHPPRREWQGLTEEKIIDAARESDLDWQKGWTLEDGEPNRYTKLARAIEQACKENNNG